jgi:divinyl protochlorophyllide a 8-vinyl-reductase
MTASAPAALVGPNAVTQLAATLHDWWGDEVARRVFRRAEADDWLTAPPRRMVPQDRVAAVHAALRSELAHDDAVAVAREAGERTAVYLLNHRIPRVLQALMKLLTPTLSVHILMWLIRANAWTFAGSGRLRTSVGSLCAIEIEDNPLAAGPCAWHEGVFGVLFRALVSPGAQVHEARCHADGHAACCFEIDIHAGDDT